MVIKVGRFFASEKTHKIVLDIALRLGKNVTTKIIIMFIRKATLIANQGAIQVTLMHGWVKHSFFIIIWFIVYVAFIESD